MTQDSDSEVVVLLKSQNAILDQQLELTRRQVENQERQLRTQHKALVVFTGLAILWVAYVAYLSFFAR